MLPVSNSFAKTHFPAYNSSSLVPTLERQKGLREILPASARMRSILDSGTYTRVSPLPIANSNAPGI